MMKQSGCHIYKNKSHLFYLFISFILIQSLYGQSNDITSTEAKPLKSIFASKSTGEEIEVLANGFWEASIISTGTFNFFPKPFSFNAVPFLFMQKPDLYTIVKYKKKWFFESWVTENLKDAHYSFGFDGDADDFVKWARLGNINIGIKDYPFMMFGAPKGSIGFALSAQKSDISFDAFVRWDGLTWKTKAMLGNTEVSEISISPANMIRGRRFVLPQPFISLVLTDTTSSGSRVLASEEYSVSKTDGLILLAAEPRGILTAQYITTSNTSGTVELYRIYKDATGKIIRTNTIYEVLNIYAMPNTDGQLFVRNLSTKLTDMRFVVTQLDKNLIEVKADGIPISTSDAYTKPFISDAPWIYANMTQPSNQGDVFSIISRQTIQITDIKLDANTIGGTITVYRDGVASASFNYNASSGKLDLLPPPRSGEYIEVRYATSTQDQTNNALSFALGSKFLWHDINFAIAFGGRWPFFGTSFDSSGFLKSGWLGLSGSIDTKTDYYTVNSSFMARYDKDSVSGLYSIAGMEDNSFTIVSGDIACIKLNTETANGLSLLYPYKNVMTKLRPNGNKCLSIACSADPPSIPSGAETHIVKYVEPIPLFSYKKLSFFIKANNLNSDASFSIEVGSDSGDGISIHIPNFLSWDNRWHRVDVDISPQAVCKIYDADGVIKNSNEVITSFSIPTSVRRIKIIIKGLKAGDICLDEIRLEDAKDGFSGLGTLFFDIHDPSNYGPYLKLDAFGVAAKQSSIAARIITGWVHEFFSLEFTTNPSYALNKANAGFGYSIAVPNLKAPIFFTDQFSWDGGMGRYGKLLEFSAITEHVSFLANNSVSEAGGVFNQKWKSGISWKKYIVISGEALSQVNTSIFNSLVLPSAWLRSWELIVPTDEDKAKLRKISSSLSIYNNTLDILASHNFASGIAKSLLEAKLSYAFEIKPIVFTPYYSRSGELSNPTESKKFVKDIYDFSNAVKTLFPLWGAIPFYELWSKDEFIKLSTKLANTSNSKYTALAGFEIKRSMGYGLLDLIPLSLNLSYARNIVKASDSFIDSGVTSVKIRGGAVNLFAASGVKPVLSSVSLDEYSYGLSMDFYYYPSDNKILPAIQADAGMSFEYLSGHSFSISSKFNYSKNRTSAPWSYNTSFALSLKPNSTWLGSLAKLIFNAWLKNNNSDEKETWISMWLNELRTSKLSMVDVFALDTAIGRQANSNNSLDIRLAFDYSTKVFFAKSLSAAAGLGFWTSITVINPDNLSIWKFGYKIFFELKIMF